MRATAPAKTVNITLTISEWEAIALYTVAAHIGGPVEGIRGIFSGQPDSLAELLPPLLGRTHMDLARHPIFKSTSGRIGFPWSTP